ncbi:MAG TPA: hypothetical protein VF988_08780 [Verrucomicrobiae bacterium]
MHQQSVFVSCAMPFSDKVLHRTAELFFGPGALKNQVIANQVNSELNPNRRLNRQTVYDVLREAKAKGILSLSLPVDRQFQDMLRQRFPTCRGTFHVVPVPHPNQNARVADFAADRAISIIMDIASSRASKTVGLGLGPGRATLDFCKFLGEKIKSTPLFPKLRLVSISAGCPANMPDYASSSFFHLFPDENVQQKIGLFAESLVRAGDLRRIKTTPGVHEAFEAKSQDVIDVVATAMGDFSDSHDLLSTFLKDVGMSGEDIKRRRWVGNVQYRPYTSDGPVVEKDDEFRAVTVFELKDLKEMSKLRNKHVILMARQCGICGRTRAKALMPLLTNPDLQVFSELVLDSATANELLQ